jgi:hypothetical protein
MEVAEDGSVELTGIIHPNAAMLGAWTTFLPLWVRCSPPHQQPTWPEEIGGQATLDEILKYCEKPGRRREIEDLLKPERNRLHKQMERAITRMLDQVYET